MGPSFSPNENYPFLPQFLLPDDYENLKDYRDALIKELDKVWHRDRTNSTETNEYISVRENVFSKVI